MATTMEDLEALLPWNVKPILGAQKAEGSSAPFFNRQMIRPPACHSGGYRTRRG